MVAVSRYAVGSSLLMLSVLIGCDHTVVDPSTTLFRIAEAPPSATEPPAAPGPLSTSVRPWMIEVWWRDNAWEGANKEDGFKVERCEAVACGDADFTVIAVNLKGENYLAWNFYNDTDVQPGSTYTYRVRAFNSAGQSAPSNAASATACFVDTDWEGGGYYICVDP